MRFVSYAQNYEDVMLWRALQHVQGGFYVDVGANDPLKDSVTKAFSERGWHGINIEPVSAHHADLQADRPFDVNLRLAVGDRVGSIELWECTLPGLATTDRAVVEQHLREGREGQWQTVPVTTLAAICEQYRGAGEIHFLKVDVEGGEERVLRGADFRRFRPWIVVVEATRPNSTEPNYGTWEPLLLAADYRFVYADGLNRFYLAGEHADLASAFAAPPNIFDGFMVAQQFNAETALNRAQDIITRLDLRLREVEASAADAQRRAVEMAARAQAWEQRAQEAQRRGDEATARAVQMLQVAQSAQRSLAAREAQLEQARTMIQLLYASTSWRITKPLRWISGRLKGERAPGASVQHPAAAPERGPAAGRRGARRAAAPHGAALYLPARARGAYDEIKAAADEAGESR